MNNKVTEFEVTDTDGSIIMHILIDRGNGEFTSMLKETWDEQQKAAELGETL